MCCHSALTKSGLTNDTSSLEVCEIEPVVAQLELVRAAREPYQCEYASDQFGDPERQTDAQRPCRPNAPTSQTHPALQFCSPDCLTGEQIQNQSPMRTQINCEAATMCTQSPFVMTNAEPEHPMHNAANHAHRPNNCMRACKPHVVGRIFVGPRRHETPWLSCAATASPVNNMGVTSARIALRMPSSPPPRPKVRRAILVVPARRATVEHRSTSLPSANLAHSHVFAQFPRPCLIRADML